MIQAIVEPYDSIVRILSKLQFKAAKKDLTGVHDAAMEIQALIETQVKEARKDQVFQDFISLSNDVDAFLEESQLIDWRDRQLDEVDRKLEAEK